MPKNFEGPIFFVSGMVEEIRFRSLMEATKYLLENHRLKVDNKTELGSDQHIYGQVFKALR